MSSSQDIVIKESGSFIKKRRAARILAIQCLYNIAQIPEKIKSFESIVQDVLLYAHAQGEDFDQEYFLTLINSSYSHVGALRLQVQRYLLKNWKISRLPEVIQAILTLGVYELIYNFTVPHKIIIHEYITMSKIFNHRGESGFVNSILDKISKEFPRESNTSTDISSKPQFNDSKNNTNSL